MTQTDNNPAVDIKDIKKLRQKLRTFLLDLDQLIAIESGRSGHFEYGGVEQSVAAIIQTLPVNFSQRDIRLKGAAVGIHLIPKQIHVVIPRLIRDKKLKIVRRKRGRRPTIYRKLEWTILKNVPHPFHRKAARASGIHTLTRTKEEHA